MPLVPGRPQKKSPTASADVVNRSGAFAGGSTGSGTATYQPQYGKPVTGNAKRAILTGAYASGTFRGGPSGSGVVKDQWVGEGADKRYVQVPDPVKGSGGAVPRSYTQIKRDNAKNVDAGTSRNAPRRQQNPTPPKEDESADQKPTESADANQQKNEQKNNSADTSSSSSSSASSSSGGKAGKSAPAVPGTLNYFMRMTMKDGKKNARNRAYQMFKNYKKSGKLPGDMGSATQ